MLKPINQVDIEFALVRAKEQPARTLTNQELQECLDMLTERLNEAITVITVLAAQHQLPTDDEKLPYHQQHPKVQPLRNI